MRCTDAIAALIGSIVWCGEPNKRPFSDKIERMDSRMDSRKHVPGKT